MWIASDVVFIDKVIYFCPYANPPSAPSEPHLQCRDALVSLVFYSQGVQTSPSASLIPHCSQLGLSLAGCMSKARIQWSCCIMGQDSQEWDPAP